MAQNAQQTVKAPKGVLHFRVTDGKGLSARVEGTGAEVFASPLITAMTALAQAGPLHALYDFEHMTNYDSGLRTALTSWFLENRRRMAGLHVFTTSKLVAMGVSVANVALGGLITVHDTRSAFDGVFTKHGVVPVSLEGVRTAV